MKYGRMASRSMTFMMFFRKVMRSGQDKKRTSSSVKNHTMQPDSMMKKGSVASGMPWSMLWSEKFAVIFWDLGKKNN